MQHSQDAKWTPGHSAAHQGDQVPLQDQDQAGFMLSTQQLASCLQMSTPMSLNLGAAQQAPTTTMWVQAQDCQQPGMLLTHNSGVQQPTDSSLWGMPSQSLQQQQQAVIAASTAQLQQQLTTAMLQGDGSLVSLLPPHASTDMNGMQAVLHGQVSQPMQMQQQVYVTASGEHVMLVSSGQGATMQQQQQQALAPPCADATGGSSGMLEAQLQQLQEAVQRLSCENAAVQQVIMSAQVSQPQDAAITAGVVSLEGPSTSNSSPTALQPDTPVLGAALSNSSPPSSFSGHDSMSGSWHCLESLGSSNSNPSFRLQNRSRLAAGAMPAPANSMQGPAVVHVLRAPDMPQGAGVGLVSMAHGQPQTAMAPAGQGGMVVFSQAGWTPSGAASYVPVAAAPAGSLAGSISFQQQQQQHHVPAGYIGNQGTVMLGRVYDQAALMTPGIPHNQHAARFGGAQGYMQQRPFRGNSKPFGTFKSRAGGQAAPRPSSASGGKPPTPPQSEGAAAAAPASNRSIPAGPWADVTLEEGLKQLWSGEQLMRARGGRLFNVQQLAWHPVGEPDPCAQDMYNFQKLKRMVQKLDAVHKTRVKLIKRIHAVADHSESDLKSVYREVRALIGEMLHDSAMQIKSLDECRVAGLVRLALMLQEALSMGPQQAADTSNNTTTAIITAAPAVIAATATATA